MAFVRLHQCSKEGYQYVSGWVKNLNYLTSNAQPISTEFVVHKCILFIVIYVAQFLPLSLLLLPLQLFIVSGLKTSNHVGCNISNLVSSTETSLFQIILQVFSAFIYKLFSLLFIKIFYNYRILLILIIRIFAIIFIQKYTTFRQ